jgi:hypothetical protein
MSTNATELSRVVILEDRPDSLALIVELRDGEVLADVADSRQAFQLPKESGDEVYTIKGNVPRKDLLRCLQLTENDNEYAVSVVWFLGQELVRRDAHVILKHASAVAGAIAGGF